EHDGAVVPTADDGRHAFGGAPSTEQAAVQQQRVRRRAIGVAREERRDVARDRGILLVWEAERDQPGPTARRTRVARDLGQEAVEHDVLHLLARELAAERRADEARSAARDANGDVIGGSFAEQALLGGAAG